MMEAAVVRHSLCLPSAFHYNRRRKKKRGGAGGFPSYYTLRHKYQAQERKPAMFLTVLSATDRGCSPGDESESSNSCVPGGGVALQRKKRKKERKEETTDDM